MGIAANFPLARPCTIFTTDLLALASHEIAQSRVNILIIEYIAIY